MSDMNEIIKSTLDSIKAFANVESVIGNVISTPSGLTVIPISKISVGFIGAGADYGQKKLSQSQSFGCGSGTGISVTPIAFLTVTPDSAVNLISIEGDKSNIDKISLLLDRSPEIIERIKSFLS